MLSKPIDQIVGDQMATVTANFNSSPNFNGIYNFEVDSIYVFDGPAQTEVFRAHPHFQYCVVIDGKFTTPTVGGGWYGSYQTIYHSWDWNVNFDSGPFGPGATDGLTHEFGHSRGAIDIYGLRVEGAKNPVNGQTFEPVNSIMNFPYGNIVWDEYTTSLLNSTADGPITGEAWITSPFPSKIELKAVTAQGLTLDNVRLEVYPVDWFSYAVGPSPVWQKSTDANGIMEFSSNPFQPASSGYPWTMRYSNFLIKATYNSTTVYTWMPLYDVQNAYFQNGPNSIYTAELVFPASTPVLKLTDVNSSTVCSPGTVIASLSATGAFQPDNTFNLYLVDNFNSSPVIGSVQSTSSITIFGTIPYGIHSGAHSYSLVIASTNPVLRTSAYPITINATPMAPLVDYSVNLCQHSIPQPLQATGQNLLWYTNPSGGKGSTSAPIPSTSEQSLKTYFVSQTIGGCESQKAMMTVTVYPTPTASLTATGPLTASLTSATLIATGGYSYTFSGPGILSQDHNSGIALANVSGTYSVTVSGWAGCIATANVALAGTDLTPTLVLPQANFPSSGSQGNFVVNLFEVAGLPTSLGNVAITITAPVGYSLTFDPAQTSINVTGGETNPIAVKNTNWIQTNSLASRQISLMLKSDQLIPAGGQINIGFTLTRTTANSGSVSNITVNISDDATMLYDGNPFNNVYARIINSL
ncbi:Ig-like domain-containing protein [Spirosoma foliorum]|uniref:Ig-like domain-containing protein n=1 Tax=Spirosoma foliorum TaxID=2710596 RepID=A0A7G5GQ70_9BACT|nr:hypothetical protein [Spirosoma foliorum]QMW01012.1 hypothetical protein H3H32_23955 [Spirosoma foliorum]